MRVSSRNLESYVCGSGRGNRHCIMTTRGHTGSATTANKWVIGWERGRWKLLASVLPSYDSTFESAQSFLLFIQLSAF